MPLRDLLGAPRDQPYAESDPRNPKNYYKVIYDKRKADEAEQDRRMSEAYVNGKLKRRQPDSSGVARQTAVEAGVCERNIPGVISHNGALYFANHVRLDAYREVAAKCRGRNREGNEGGAW
jgi:hypothetical protein